MDEDKCKGGVGSNAIGHEEFLCECGKILCDFNNEPNLKYVSNLY